MEEKPTKGQLKRVKELLEGGMGFAEIVSTHSDLGPAATQIEKDQRSKQSSGSGSGTQGSKPDNIEI